MSLSQNPRTESTPVLIAGAGPVGLSLAAGLAHHGVRSLVIEKKTALSEHSRAPGILPRTLEILQTWGVLDSFLSEGTFLDRPTIWRVGRDRPWLRLPLEYLAGETSVPGLLVLPQNRTEALLAEHVARSSLADVRFGHELRDLADSGEHVTATVAVGHTTCTVTASFLVGCDGASSTVRGRLGWPLEGHTYPARITLADVSLPDDRDRLPWPRIAAEPPLQVAIRLQPRLWRIIDPVEAGVSDDEALSQTRLQRQVERLLGAGPFETIWSSLFRIHCRNSPHFRKGRVLLAGDAAHINSPAGGQGMNSGIQDAHNLAWKLSRALNGGDLETLLASYEAERRPVVLTSIDRYTDRLTRFVLLGGRIPRFAFLAAVRLALRVPPLRRQILRRMAMLDAVYKGSPLLIGSDRRVGSRAPDVPLDSQGGRPTRLHELCARRACLLWCALHAEELPAIEELRAAVSDLDGVDVAAVSADGQPTESHYVDRNRSLFRQLAIRGSTALLLRPDGHVGWLSEGPDLAAVHDAVAAAIGAGPAVESSLRANGEH